MQAYGEYGSVPPRRGPSMGLVVFVAIVFGLLAGLGGTMLALWANQHGIFTLKTAAQASMPAQITSTATKSGSPAGSAQKSFAQVADELDESVVNIDTKETQVNPFAIFGSQQVQGLGTGIIVSADGYILTNYHVAGEAESITVTVMHKGGKKQYKARLIGGDKLEDLAVIKIDASGLSPVKFGDSDAMRPGDWVMAIGNPFGLEHTVSVGVVSALNRDLPVSDAVTLKGTIQTDASINPGNSGGPLVDLQGEVIGINSAVYVGRGSSGGPQANGIGFAIPSNRAVKIMNELRSGHKIAHPYIGVVYKAVDDEVRQKMHVSAKEGVVVLMVSPNSPASKAGIKAGDIIMSINGVSLQDKQTLSDYLNKQKVGSIAKLEAMSWDNERTSWVTKTYQARIADRPPNYEQQMHALEQRQQQQSQTNIPQDGSQQPGDNGDQVPFP